MSTHRPVWRALALHCSLLLRLNFRSPAAIAYGYLMPVLFLVAFGSVFRGEQPLLWHQMGQILTISLLGGACFGFPTTLVSEREQGIWRRYQLLPFSPGWLLGSALCARLVLVASMTLLQIGLARLIYHTPWPVHPLQLAVVFLFVAFAFLGLGLLVAALADQVPAVQALGQCLFLPMVLIGGVGVPLAALPEWAQRLAAFMPGRHAVEALQASYSDPRGWSLTGVNLAALALIGLAAVGAGLRLFRWESGRRAGRREWRWAAAVLLAWALGGLLALGSGRIRPLELVDSVWENISAEQIAAIAYDDLPGDNEFVTRISPPFRTPEQLRRARDITTVLRLWAPGQDADSGQAVRSLVATAAIVDLSRDTREGDFGRVVFEHLQAGLSPAQLRQALAWIILDPAGGRVPVALPEFGVRGRFDERIVRERSRLYAKKYLGRLLGRIQEPN